MKIQVTGQEIEITDKYLLVTETENLYEVEYSFDDTWDDFSKTAVFKDATNTYSVVLTGDSCAIPNECIEDSGNIQFGVYGTKVDGSTTYTKPTVWSEKLYVDVGCVLGSTVPTPTPSVYAQIVALAEQARDSASAAATSASASASSASDAQNSAAIATGAVSHTPYINATNYHWMRWNATNQAYEDTGVDARGADDFEELSNRPKYNGSVMTGDTNIPEVKTSAWDAKADTSDIPTKTSELTNDSGFITDTKAFVATYGTTTASEIATAITAGKAIFCRYTNSGVTNQLMLVDETNSKYGFAESTVGTNGDITTVSGIVVVLNRSTDEWSIDTGSSSIPTKTSDLTNDGDGNNPFLTEHQSLETYQQKTDISLSTTAKTVVGAINELDSEMDDKVDKLTTSGQRVYSHDGSTQGELAVSTAISSASTNQQVASAKAVYDFNGRQFELIETITLSEAVASLTRTTTPSGKAYNFKAVQILMSNADSPIGSGGFVKFYNNSSDYSSVYYTTSSSAKFASISIDTCETIISALFRTSQWEYYNVNTMCSVNTQMNKNIVDIRIFGNASNLPADTEIKIYGIWA